MSKKAQGQGQGQGQFNPNQQQRSQSQPASKVQKVSVSYEQLVETQKKIDQESEAERKRAEEAEREAENERVERERAERERAERERAEEASRLEIVKEEAQKAENIDNLEPQTSDAIEPELIEHPLQFEWQFWTNNKSVQATQKTYATYADHYIEFGNVATIEQFWGSFNNMPTPSKFPGTSDLMFFKKGIMPKWEHPRNENGSEFVLTLTNDPATVDRCWRFLLLAVIGQQLEGDDEDIICGVSMARREKSVQQTRFEIWTSVNQSDNMRQMQTLRETLAKLLNVRPSDFQYKDHRQEISKNRARGH